MKARSRGTGRPVDVRDAGEVVAEPAPMECTQYLILIPAKFGRSVSTLVSRWTESVGMNALCYTRMYGLPSLEESQRDDSLSSLYRVRSA